MKSLNILEALAYLKENAMDLGLAQAITDCINERLDNLEEIVPRDSAQADALENEIDALSEISDIMIVVLEECKTYSKSVKQNPNADDSKVQDVLAELNGYLDLYDDNFQCLEKLAVIL